MEEEDGEGPFLALIVEDDPTQCRLYRDILGPDKRFRLLFVDGADDLTAKLQGLQALGLLIDLLLLGGELWPVSVPRNLPVNSTWRMWDKRLAACMSKEGFVLGVSAYWHELTAMREFFFGQHALRFELLNKPFENERLRALIDEGLGLSNPK